MKKSTVSKRKRDMSSRSGSRPFIPYVESANDVVFTFKNYDHIVDFGNRLRFVSTESKSAVDNRDSFFYFHPKNKSYKPFLWRGPKPYFRQQLTATALSLKATPRTRPGEEPYSVDCSGTFLYQEDYRTPWLWPNLTYNDRNKHLIDFNQKLADQKVDFLTTVVEGRQSIVMLADAAFGLFELYRMVRKADTKGIKRFFSGRNIKDNLSKAWRNKTVESRWLEIQYGWAPLIGDISTIFEEIADGRSTPPLLKVSHSSILHHEDYNNRYNYVTIKDYFGVVKTTCYYTVDSPKLRQSARWNMINNPLLTAWELIPYSFVADWFMPIGDFLAQFSSSHGLQYVSGTTVHYTKWSAERSRFFGIQPRLTSYYADCESITEQRFYLVKREVHTSSPIGFPYFDAGWSTKRALNALALISQRRK